MFVDCYSKYTILVPSSNHTAYTVSKALLRHVIPYFGTPRRLLSDRGREFIRDIWTKLLRSLRIQWVLTSPYHPESNARLLEGSSSKAWVDKVPGIMLTLNAMSHEPHGFSVSMIATGREPTLPPDVHLDTHPSPSVDNPSDYVEAIKQRLQLTHQQVTSPPPPPPVANPYHVGIMAIVRRRLVPFNLRVPGTRCLSTLWDLCQPITARNSSSCLWIATPSTPYLYHPAITPRTR